MAHPRRLIVAFMVIFTIAIVAVQVVASSNDRQRTNIAVASCERGNFIRDYLGFDNAESISVLKGSLRVVPDTADESYVETRRRSLEQREAYQALLVPFDCESLR